MVVLGKATPVALDLAVGGVDAVVDISASDNATIDTTDTKIQTNITSEIAELLPKGTNFASLLKVSLATRPNQSPADISRWCQRIGKYIYRRR
ncbi:MAG: hypothetical protein R2681_15075 [Pyrinomonadaceae bacterium]